MAMVSGERGDTLLRYELRHSLRNTANRFQVYALITRVERAVRVNRCKARTTPTDKSVH